MMKKLIALLLAAAMLLTMTACGAAEPAQTVPPTTLETVPTEAPTDAPTEPKELTEAEKKQLHYEQIFADGTYVMDWSCVNIIVDTDYRVELYSDENGVFWEELSTLEGDPHYFCSYYYRRNADLAYHYMYTLEDYDGDYNQSESAYVDVSSPKEDNIVNSTVNSVQTMFNEFLARQKELTYEEVEGEDTVVAINCGNLDSLVFHINPETLEVSKLYVVNYDKVYSVEFVHKTVADIIQFDNLPFTITETTTFAAIKEYRDRLVTEITSHRCDWTPSNPIATVKLTDEETQQEQEKWEEVFADNAYIMNWDSVKIDMGSSYHVEVLSDEKGIYWEAITTLEGDPHQYYSYFYRNEANSAYYITYTPEDGTSCLLVDMPSQNDGTYAYSRVVGVQWLYDQVYSRQKEVVYKGMMDGAAVIKINCGPIESLTFHIDPYTCEVRKLYIVDSSGTDIDNVYYVEFVPSTAAKKTAIVPSTINGTITLDDVFNQAADASVEIAMHGCQKHWLPREERQRGIDGPDGED